MKRLYFIIVAVIIFATLFGQAPAGFKYQAVLRDASGNVRSNTNVSIDVAILQGNATGTQVFIETHIVTTNEFGLINLEIGSKNTSGFADIVWSEGPYFMKIIIDGTEMGTSQLLSVPYAMYAKTVENGFSGNYEDLTNTPTLFSGSYNDLTDKPSLFDGTWTILTGKPTTLTGYGITDAMSTSHIANGITSTNITNWNSAFVWGNHSGLYRPITYVPAWSEISSKPTTIAGFGISDAVTTSGNQTIGGNKTFTGTINVNNKTITNLASPVNTNDAVNKGYVDDIKETIYNELLDAGMNGIVKDVEGNTYKTIKIGDQVWMAENLAYLPSLSYEISSTTIPHYYVGEDVQTVVEAKSTGFYKTYGVVYNWPAAVNACPSGWHLPSIAEWNMLIDYLGGGVIAADKLKEVGTHHWIENRFATNESGFTALPAGIDLISQFEYSGFYCAFWSNTESTALNAKSVSMMSEGAGNFDEDRLVVVGDHHKAVGISVRCIKD